MTLRHVWIIPLLSFVFSISAFIVSYIIAVEKGHVNAFWPYISDSGTLAPESCYFGQLLNFAALFFGLSVYLRHRQIIEFYWHHCGQKGRWRCYSTIFLWIGYISAVGVSLVANFQETRVIEAHYFGAFLAFTLGLLYLWAQTMFSYLMSPRLSSLCMANFRLVLNLLSTVSYCVGLIFATIAKPPAGVTKHEENQVYKWKPEDPLYVQHTIATVSEWAMACCFNVYILSFALELRDAKCHAPKLRLHENTLAKSRSECSSSASPSLSTIS